MARVNRHQKKIMLDMTAMCDIAFLLLAFFILTTKFKPDEAFPVEVPSSTQKSLIVSDSLMIISLDKSGKVFLSLTDQKQRMNLIKLVNQVRRLGLPEQNFKKFAETETFGIPMASLKDYLGNTGGTDANLSGIPSDSDNNELITWIRLAKQLNPSLKIAIKGDRASEYSMAKNVINTLQDLGMNRISFITEPEQSPALN